MKTEVSQSTRTSSRPTALKILLAVLRDGRSLESARDDVFARADAADRPRAMEIANGVLRWRTYLEALLAPLLRKPLRGKDEDIRILLLMALYELEYMSAPEYAVVNETTALCRRRRKTWAAGVVNGVLRNFLRRREELVNRPLDDEARLAHPQWLLQRLQRDWPQDWTEIAEADNARAPMWLRVNARCSDADAYARTLQDAGHAVHRHPVAPQALCLAKPVNVEALPGFAEGAVSVQDAGAQLCAELLQVQAGDAVLDLCAAPGGKTCHLLERQPDLRVTAVDIDATRLRRVQENLDRLGLEARCVVADARHMTASGDSVFDRILVDAPCSATGVIRRHPDIKSLRREDDIDSLVRLQSAILENAWQMLAPGGTLLYVTCSVLRAENEERVVALLAEYPDAVEEPVEASWGIACRHGRQLLPGEDDCDGFYFARLRKRG